MPLAQRLPALHYVRFRTLLLAVLAAGLFIRTAVYWQTWQPGQFLAASGEAVIQDGPSPEEDYLRRLVGKYRLTNLTTWRAWAIRPSGRAEHGSSLTQVRLNFEPPQLAKTIDLRAPSPSDLRASRSMALPVRDGARVDKADASDFLFAVSTSYQRIAALDWALVRTWERWLTRGNGQSNGAGLVLMLDNASDEQRVETDRRLRGRGIDVYTVATNEPVSAARRYYELVRILKTYSATLAANGLRKRWFGLVDDTVFFPSLSYLAQRLATAYSPGERSLYIGLPSERLDWREAGDSITTDGGGAVFLTLSAVADISRLPCLDTAGLKPPFKPRRWDALLHECVERHAAMETHVVPALYSPRDGLPHVASHETGVRPLALHDYQGRHRVDVAMAHLVADACGDACFMQRYLFRDAWVLVNGVSISQHPNGELERRRRHDDGHGRTEVSAGLAKQNVSARLVVDDTDEVETTSLTWIGRRKVWKLLDSTVAANGAVWQAYWRRSARSEGLESEGLESQDEMDSVIVLIWENAMR